MGPNDVVPSAVAAPASVLIYRSRSLWYLSYFFRNYPIPVRPSIHSSFFYLPRVSMASFFTFSELSYSCPSVGPSISFSFYLPTSLHVFNFVLNRSPGTDP